MVRVKMNLSKMNGAQKVEFTRFCTVQMTGNANFVTPQPTGATMASGANKLEAAILAAKGGGPKDTATMRLREEELNGLLRQLVSYVETTANANPTAAEAIILSAGMQVRGKYSRSVPNFIAAATGNPGEIRVQSKAVDRATYEFQISIDISKEENWSTFNFGTRSRVYARDLSPNQHYYFRVRVTSSNGRSEWSEVRSVYLASAVVNG